MKKIFIFFLTILLSYCLTVLLSSPVYAQDAPPTENYVDGDYAECMTSEDGALTTGRMCLGGYASAAQTSFMADFVRRTLGPIPGLTITERAYKNNPRLVAQMQQGSAVTGISTYIAYMYMNPPANTTTFIADMGHSLGFMPKAYAQGIGFSGMSALLPIWKVFRNIAYVLMSLVFIIIGFMVMLRKKIDPKTVVTIQNALPKIVLTLLIITFSYAIVGIMVDLMYVSILLTVSIFKSTGLLPDPSWIARAFGYTSPESLYSQGGILTNFWNLFGVGSVGIPNIAEAKTGLLSMPELTNLILAGNSAPILSGTSTLLLVGGLAVALFGGPAAAGGLVVAALGALTPFITLLIAIALLILILRLFIFFLSSYIQIILSLIFAPLQLVAEALPGSTAFSGWMKNLFANLIVFPIGAIVFMLSAIFAKLALDGGGKIWAPPFTVVSGSSTSIFALLSLAILFLIPTVAGSIKEALKTKPAIPIGSAIGQAFGTPVATAQQLLSASYYIKGFFPQKIPQTLAGKKPD